jgi:2-polyprenyl-6-methoxyphenol hydroxylase-like FAD-dependent oxidoreductase
MADVLVVGAGPVGLIMACELARHDVRCRIVDRLAQPLPYCRAIGITPRTLEVLDDMGIAREMIDAGIWIEGLRSIIHGHPANDSYLDLRDLPYSELGLPQYETERLLVRHLARFGIPVERGIALDGLSQTDDGVAVRLARADGQAEDARFRYVVGCDGVHSTVRRALGIAFEGEAFPMLFMLGDVHIAWNVPRGFALRAVRLVEGGAPDMFIAIPLPEAGRYRVSMLAPPELASSDGSDHGIQSELRGPDLAHLQSVADDLVPGGARLSELHWSSIFRISMRLAEHYRRGRVFIAGDAAHIHPPTGGQGMNTGMQDAYNLAWKLALVLQGAASESLLDSYEAERRPAGADVVARTRAASEGYGREPGGKADRLADTQILIPTTAATGCMTTQRVSIPRYPPRAIAPPTPAAYGGMESVFPFACSDVLRGIEHVLIAHLPSASAPPGPTQLATFSKQLHARVGSRLRLVMVTAAESAQEQPGVAVYRDEQGEFAAAYGAQGVSFLVRPDGYIGWRGRSWDEKGLFAYLAKTLDQARRAPA